MNLMGYIQLTSSPASYDYGSPIAESRELTTKHAELKRQGLFLRSSPEFYKTDWVGDSTTGTINVTNSNAFVTYLRNPDTSAGFYIARQNDSTATSVLVPTLVAMVFNILILGTRSISN